MEVGERVRELREARGWTRTKLARLAGVSRQTVFNIERPTRDWPITDVVLARVALALDIPLADLDAAAAERITKLAEAVS